VILAIDPSLTGTAVVIGGPSGVYDIRRFSSHHRTDTVYHRIQRYRGLVAEVAAYIGCQSIDAVFIEGYSLGHARPGVFQLTEYGGLLRVMLLDLTSDIYEVPPSSLKRFAAGKGNAKKPVVAKCLSVRYGVRFDTDDEYDAFGLYRLGLCVLGHAEPHGLAQCEVVEQIRNPQPKPRKPRKPGRRKKKENTLFS